MTQRRYRENQSRPIPVWNGVLEHCGRIDAAIWVFLWLLDAITEERDGVGIVRGAAPLKASRIAKDLCTDEWTVRKHLRDLERGRYIRRRRTPYGAVIEVSNSRKFGIWKAHERSGESQHLDQENGGFATRDRGNLNARTGKSQLTKKTQQYAAKNAAAATQPATTSNLKDSVWGFLGINPSGPASFQSQLEAGWVSRNGGPSSILIGNAIDAWEGTEGRKLPNAAPLFRALDRLRKEEKQQPTVVSDPIHTFSAEEIPV
jgi:hypothetical protein